ncbi:sensor domain-containing diguanylate cyclase [Ramlibacter sp. PS4R-6]|uniref:sensor domain-containing diguanylate cyclase n=1 Tax=Ramlibacter sp. PS4R-6 TaxID=3133438 RepID=UPI0030987363
MTYPRFEAGKFMRCAVAALLALAACAAAFAAAPPPARAQVLSDQGTLDALESATVWYDPRGTATLEQVLQGTAGASFQPARPEQIHSLGDGQLWLRWRFTRARNAENGWLIVFPMPALDNVTLHQQNERGYWTTLSAGDTIPVASWAEPGRYPHFRLELPAGQTRDVYARIRHLTPANFPVQLMPESAFDERIQVEYLGLGLAFGALLLLITACITQSFVYRDAIYGWYAGYAVVTTLGVAAYTGVAAHLLWPGFGALGDAPQGMLALLAGSAAILFIRNLIGISGRHHVIDKCVLATGLAGIALAALLPVIAKGPGLALVGAYVAGATLVNMWIAFEAWRRGDTVGAWVLVAYGPLTLAVLLAVGRMAGWLPVSFGTQYAIVVAMAIEVPLLLVALNIRSRERHGAQIRELALSSQDALTGLLAAHLFHDRLRQVVARFKRDPDNAAIVFIDLVNYPQIKAQFGSAVAEQSLLRSVIKLRRLLRDVDTVSRIGEARFGLILEGVTSRIAVTDRAARLIAAGLMPLKGLKPEVTLQFHIGAVLLEERMGEPEELVSALDELLASMSPRTRRPIRFLEPEDTQPQALATDSGLLGGDSVLPSTPPVGGSVVPLTRKPSSQ